MSVVKTSPAIASEKGFHIRGSLLARNTMLNVAGRVIPLLVGIATMPYIIRHLGPARFGLLSLAWIVVGYFALFDLGIGPATTKFVAELLGKGETERLPALVWTALATQSSFGLVAGVLLAAASPALVEHLLKIPPELQTDARWVFLILAVSLPIGFASGSLGGVLAASQRFDLLVAVGISTSLLSYLIPAGALALGFGLRGIVLLMVVSQIVGLGAYFLFCLRLYPALGRASAFHRSLVRPLLGFGGWMTVSGAVAPILVYFDRFLIGALQSIAAVGFYTPPYTIATKLGILPSSLAATLFPAFSTSTGRGDNEWISNVLVRSLKCLLLIVGTVALVMGFFARPLLTLWLGTKFAAEGTLVLQILVAGMLVNSLALVPYNLLQGIGRPDLTAKFHLLEIPLHVGLTWFLVTKYSLPGAALAWALRVSLDFLLLIVAACSLTHTPARLLVSRDLLGSVAMLAGLAAGLTILRVSSHVLLTNACFTLLLTTGVLVAAWHYVLDAEEKWQIRSWLKVAR